MRNGDPFSVTSEVTVGQIAVFQEAEAFSGRERPFEYSKSMPKPIGRRPGYVQSLVQVCRGRLILK